MNNSELAAQAAALERAHDYAGANKLWTDAAQAQDDNNKNQYATRRAAFCAMALKEKWA